MSSNPSQANSSGVWRTRLANIWQRITEPHLLIREPERRRARMFAALLVALIAAGIVAVAATFVIDRMSYDFRTLLVGIVELLIIYWLSRSRYFRWAALATIAVIFITVSVIALADRQILRLDFLALAIVAGSLFFSTRQMILLSLITIGMTLSLFVFVPGALPQEITAVDLLLSSISVLAIVGAHMSRRDLAQIEAQARTLADKIEERKQAEETLRASEERFRSTLESMMEGCQIIDYDWRYLFVNDAVTMHGRQSKDELLGRTMMECYPGIEDTDMFGVLRRCMEERTSHNMQNEFRYPDGTQGWFELSIQPAPDGLFILSTDVTARVQAEENLRQQTARAEALVRTAARLNAELKLDAVLETVCTETARSLDVQAVVITLVDQSNNTVSVAADYGLPSDYRRRIQPMPLAAYAASIAQNPGPLVVPDVQAWPDIPDAELHREMDIRTVVRANLRHKGIDLGGLNVITFGEIRHFSQDGLALLQGLADQASQAIANAQLYAEHVQYEKILRISEDSLKEAQKIAKIGSWTRDMASNNVVWSDEIYTILGLDKAENSDTLDDFFQFIHPDDRARVAQVTEQAIKEARLIPLEYRILTPDGTLKHVTVQGTIVKDEVGNPTHLFGTIQDISERKQVEAERVARQSAERANAAKSEFLSRMSHELRTPMNSILGFAQLLEMSQKEPLSSTQYGRVGQILKAGQHLLDLINEVLEISRIEAGRLQISLEAVAVGQIVSDVLDLTAPLADERHIHVYRGIDPEQKTYVTADKQRLKQVFINLVSNAIKYNHKGGEVWLTSESRPDGRLRISVRDSGPGIAPDQQMRLFQPFDRLGAEGGEVAGTGLGLTLSKRLLELMGGQIGVESAVGEGSTFWMELPMAQHPANKETLHLVAKPLPAINGQVRTILYIEDNLANFELVEQVLAEESQVSLIWAIQGSIGLDLARQHRPDLILLDLHLPDIQGREVLARLRQDEATATIPVIVISADATPRQIERLKAAGADAYLTKPLNVPEFLHTVQVLLTER